MNKKSIIGILVVILLIASSVVILNIANENGATIDTIIGQKGNNIFGNGFCIKDHSLEIGGDALTKWECKICGKSFTNSDTNIPMLCDRCAKISDRCYKCGKVKLKSTVKIEDFIK